MLYHVCDRELLILTDLAQLILWHSVHRATIHQMLRTSLGRPPVSGLDLGCGTGKGGLALAKHGISKVTCCDPDGDMLAEAAVRLRRRPENTDEGTFEFHKAHAEDTGLRASFYDVAVCLQAWHWLDHDVAFREVARLLQPGGCLGIVWNDRDLSQPLVSEFEALMERYNPRYKRDMRQSRSYRDRLATDALQYEGQMSFPHEQLIGGPSALADLALTYSYVNNALAPREQARFRHDCEAMARNHHGEGEFGVPMVANLFWFAAPAGDGVQ